MSVWCVPFVGSHSLNFVLVLRDHMGSETADRQRVLAERKKYFEDISLRKAEAMHLAQEEEQKIHQSFTSLSPEKVVLKAQELEENKKKKELAANIEDAKREAAIFMEDRRYFRLKEVRLIRRALPLDVGGSVKQLITLLLKNGRRLKNIALIILFLLSSASKTDLQLPIGHILDSLDLSFADDDEFEEKIKKVYLLYAIMRTDATLNEMGPSEPICQQSCFRALELSKWSVEAAHAFLLKKENRVGVKEFLNGDPKNTMRDVIREKRLLLESSELLRERNKSRQVLGAPVFSLPSFRGLFPEQELVSVSSLKSSLAEDSDSFQLRGKGNLDRGASHFGVPNPERFRRVSRLNLKNKKEDEVPSAIVKLSLSQIEVAKHEVYRLSENITSRQAILFLLTVLDRLIVEKSLGFSYATNHNEERECLILDNDPLVVPLLSLIFWRSLRFVMVRFTEVKAHLLAGEAPKLEGEEGEAYTFHLYVLGVSFRLLRLNVLSGFPFLNRSRRRRPHAESSPSERISGVSGEDPFFLESSSKFESSSLERELSSATQSFLQDILKGSFCWVMQQTGEVGRECIRLNLQKIVQETREKELNAQKETRETWGPLPPPSVAVAADPQHAALAEGRGDLENCVLFLRRKVPAVFVCETPLNRDAYSSLILFFSGFFGDVCLFWKRIFPVLHPSVNDRAHVFLALLRAELDGTSSYWQLRVLEMVYCAL